MAPLLETIMDLIASFHATPKTFLLTSALAPHLDAFIRHLLVSHGCARVHSVGWRYVHAVSRLCEHALCGLASDDEAGRHHAGVDPGLPRPSGARTPQRGAQSQCTSRCPALVPE